MKFDLSKIFAKNILKESLQIDNLVFINKLDNSSEPKLFKNDCISHFRYKNFIKQKGRRPIYDMYACFQPFNESTKAFFPFLKKLKQQVKKNDVILNLWDRSGWLTNLLAGLFPEQQIVTTWEGNKDVLGYQGYHYWMKEHNNVTVLFCDLNNPLPFKDKSFKFSIGLDVFHRFNQKLLMEELQRVVKNDGAILFPHIHLSNSEPKPFFERGCKQIHGAEYQKMFNLFYKNNNWEGFVFSEPELFIANDIKKSAAICIKSTPNTTDYNALIALLPKDWKNTELSSYSLNVIPNLSNARILINSLLNISLHHQKVTIDYEKFDGAMRSLLERHPIYVERINELENYKLSETAVKVLFLAKSALTIEEIAGKLYNSEVKIIKELKHLEDIGLLQVLPVSESGIRLQNYLMTQEYTFENSKQTLKKLWNNTIKSFPENTAIFSLQDESEFTYNDCNEITQTIIAVLQASGLKKGDKIIICNTIHTEALFLFWACMQIGIVVVPIVEDLNDDTIESILRLTEAQLLFTNQAFFLKKNELFQNISAVLFDIEEEVEDYNLLYFSDWLNKATSVSLQKVTIRPTDEAVILFTSGSTGAPKGVQLSQGNLFRSGRLITETFHWGNNDRYFALGGLESMSGLRNSVISGLHVGACVVVPKENSTKNLFAITESIEASQATILGSNPAFLRQLVKYKSKIRGQIDSLKTIICTGNNLSNSLRNDFTNCFGKSIYNYYGLSETTGICISQSPLDVQLNIDTIGKPIDCIAQIVDENDELVLLGEQGELRIFSNNIMSTYYKNSKQTNKSIRNGWFYTQDNAKFLENGNIQLLGRKRNVVKTSTEELVYIDALQDFVCKMDLIEDVFVCSYIEYDAEKIAIFVTPNKKNEEDFEKIKEYVIKQLISKFGEKSIPNRLLILPELPYNDNGKLLKNKLLNELP